MTSTLIIFILSPLPPFPHPASQVLNFGLLDKLNVCERCPLHLGEFRKLCESEAKAAAYIHVL